MLKKQLELAWLATRDTLSKWNQLPDASRAEQADRWARLIRRAAKAREPEDQRKEFQDDIDE